MLAVLSPVPLVTATSSVSLAFSFSQVVVRSPGEYRAPGFLEGYALAAALLVPEVPEADDVLGGRTIVTPGGSDAPVTRSSRCFRRSHHGSRMTSLAVKCTISKGITAGLTHAVDVLSPARDRPAAEPSSASAFPATPYESK